MNLQSFFLALISLLVISCATVSLRDQIQPQEALAQICQLGSNVKEVKGHVLMKIDSPLGKGTFPASVKATSVPTLDMQVSNPLGGLEAEVTVRGRSYSVRATDQRYRSSQGNDEWNGIPLEWAPTLFLGQIPCPPVSAQKEARIEWISKDELLVEVLLGGARSRERYLYQLRSWRSKVWAYHLAWEVLGPLGVKVEFEFGSPDEGSGQPLRWEVKSKDGVVKARWQSREVK